MHILISLIRLLFSESDKTKIRQDHYISNWFVENNLKINVDKCKEMVIDFSVENRCLHPYRLTMFPLNA